MDPQKTTTVAPVLNVTGNQTMRVLNDTDIINPWEANVTGPTAPPKSATLDYIPIVTNTSLLPDDVVSELGRVEQAFK